MSYSISGRIASLQTYQRLTKYQVKSAPKEQTALEWWKEIGSKLDLELPEWLD